MGICPAYTRKSRSAAGRLEGHIPTSVAAEGGHCRYKCVSVVLEYGVPTSGRKFNVTEKDGVSKIITFEFEFGIPVDETRTETSLNSHEFRTEALNNRTTSQEMPR